MTTVRSAIISLDDPHARQLELVGGKGANLAELLAAGFPVPGGFCVDTTGYLAAAAATGLDDVLAAAGTARPDGALAARARAALTGAPVPEAIAEAVRAGYAQLGADVPVAVRSSATAEDLPAASFAGQQDTFLNVVGADAVLDAVRRCWASLWTDRAVSYRAEVGIDQHDVRLAVVVQRMVDAELAGVLFTADPVTGRRTRTVIDAAPGLGEAVVSGAVNPDHVVVEGDGTVAEYRVGDRATAIRPRAGGGTEHVAGTTAGRSLTDARIGELVALGRRVQARFGAPQDIEWAIDGTGALWLTQSRPITTLYPIPTDRGNDARAYFCVTLAQGLVRPITPVGLSAFRIIAAGASRELFGHPLPDPRTGPPAFAELGMRAFVDITPALRSRAGRTLLPRVLDLMESRTAVVLRSLITDPAFAMRGGSIATFGRGFLRALIRLRVPPVALLSALWPAAGRRYLDRLGRPAREPADLPPGAPVEQRLDRAEWLIGQAFPMVPRMFPVWLPGMLLLAAARRLAGDAMDGTASDGVLRSLPHNVTSGMDLELWALASRVRLDAAASAVLSGAPAAELAARHHRGQLPPVLQDGLSAFLRRYGHRAVAEIDLGLPRWSDDPTYVLGVLANYLRLDDPELAPDVQFARGARAADATVARIVDGVRQRSRPRAALLRWMLGRVRQLVGLRETHKDYLVRLLAQARSEVGTVGAELVARGRLAAADDVFFLDLREIRRALRDEQRDLPAVVAQRRADYRLELRRRHVPRILLSDGTEPEALVAAHAGAAPGDLIGTPASAGSCTGRARVILDPVDAHLEPGEILVAPSTDPGWTPLFLTAGGLVMEMGGPNSHGAVVAREYGIPAVVGVAGATVRLSTGDLVTVDGAAGLVRSASTES
ncbi:MAG TPA: PEP/pyruvate-binding domain-containing protein [Pseudonocardia sp.]|nr:PEP/pyruvate-binding domain-containing protein [Pseudonocardia sp.]